jgi:hypothetical protein
MRVYLILIVLMLSFCCQAQTSVSHHHFNLLCSKDGIPYEDYKPKVYDCRIKDYCVTHVSKIFKDTLW